MSNLGPSIRSKKKSNTVKTKKVQKNYAKFVIHRKHLTFHKLIAQKY